MLEFLDLTQGVFETLLIKHPLLISTSDFPGGSDGKTSAYNAGDPGSVPGLGRSPGERNGNPLQYSCLENPMDGGAWWATVHRGHKELDMTERLHFHFHVKFRRQKSLIDIILNNYW